MSGKRRTILLLASYSAQSQTDYNMLSTQKTKLKAEVAEIVKQSSNSIAYWIRIELFNKQFKDKRTMDAFEKHLTFHRLKNATLDDIGAGIDDSLLAALLLNSFSSNRDPIWSIPFINIVTSGTPINQSSFNHVAGELRRPFTTTFALQKHGTLAPARQLSMLLQASQSPAAIIVHPRPYGVHAPQPSNPRKPRRPSWRRCTLGPLLVYEQ